jgi:hypothetical protein
MDGWPWRSEGFWKELRMMKEFPTLCEKNMDANVICFSKGAFLNYSIVHFKCKTGGFLRIQTRSPFEATLFALQAWAETWSFPVSFVTFAGI